MTLDTLPPEVILCIVAFLPAHSTSVRPHQATLALVKTCRALHRCLTPHLNAAVHLYSLSQAHAFLEHAPALWVRSLALHRPTSGQGGPTGPGAAGAAAAGAGAAGTAWPQDLLAQLLLLTLPLAAELWIEGVDLASGLPRLLRERAAKSPSSRLAPSPWSFEHLPEMHIDAGDDPVARPAAAGSLLTFLSIDLIKSSKEDQRPHADPPPPIGPGTPSDSLLDACFDLPALAVLRIAHLPLSQTFAPRPTPTQHIRHLQLHRSQLTDSTLLALCAHASPALQGLSLQHCTGFSADALVHAVQLVGVALGRLELAFLPGDDGAHGSPSSSSSPGRRSPPPSNSAFEDLPPPSSPFGSLVDQLVPHTPGLRHLSLTGPIASQSLPILLPGTTPLLTSLSITSCPSLTPRSLVPLLASSSTPLVPLASLTLNLMPKHALFFDPSSLSSASDDRDSAEAEGARDLWSCAMDRNVRVRGTAFDEVERRVRWGVEVALGVVEQEKGEDKARKRKRPSLGL